MMNRSRFQHRVLVPLCGSFLLLVLLGPVMAQGATYYVSLTGNNANSGTSTSAPFRTLAKAVQPLKPGDTLYIRGGIWTEMIDLRNKTGTAGYYMKVAGYPGEKVTIRYADPIDNGSGPIKARGSRGYFIFENLVLDGINGAPRSGFAIRDGNHHFTLRNLEIMNFRANGLYIAGKDIQVINCKIHDARPASTSPGQGVYYYGIYAHSGSNILLQGNEVYRNSGGGLTLYPGPLSNLVVRNNSIHDNNYVSTANIGGIWLQGTSSYFIANTQIYNNLVYKNSSASTSGNADGITISYNTTGTKVWNNTVYGNKRYGLRIGYNSTTTNTVVQNNISYGNKAGNYLNTGTGTINANNLLTTDPKFVSASSNNFQLQSSSPAVNKGVKLSSVPTDYRNIGRPKGVSHDIGGYENY